MDFYDKEMYLHHFVFCILTMFVFACEAVFYSYQAPCTLNCNIAVTFYFMLLTVLAFNILFTIAGTMHSDDCVVVVNLFPINIII